MGALFFFLYFPLQLIFDSLNIHFISNPFFEKTAGLWRLILLKPLGGGKVLRVLPSGRWLPHNQGWVNFIETRLVTVMKSLYRSCWTELTQWSRLVWIGHVFSWVLPLVLGLDAWVFFLTLQPSSLFLNSLYLLGFLDDDDSRRARRRRERYVQRLAVETTWRCQKNPFIGALGIQEPVIPGEPLFKG